MTAIVGNAFRKYNADSFIDSFSTNNVYLMIGKKDEWASTSPGQYAGSGFSDTSIPSTRTIDSMFSTASMCSA